MAIPGIVYNKKKDSQPWKERIPVTMHVAYSALTANILSIMLIVTLYLSNRHRMHYDADMKNITRMMGIAFYSNVADTVVSLFSGVQGTFITVLLKPGRHKKVILAYERKKPYNEAAILCRLHSSVYGEGQTL